MTTREAIKLLLRSPRLFLAACLSHAPLFLQSQMDIRPESPWHNPDFLRGYGGFFTPGDVPPGRLSDLEPWDNVRRDMLLLLLRTIQERNVEGDFAEVGVYKGLTARLIHYYAPSRRLHLFDTFEGFTERGSERELETTDTRVSATSFADTNLEAVTRHIGPQNSNVVFHSGYFPDSIPSELSLRRFAFVHLDADLFEPVLEGLRFFYPRLNSGGMIVIHDYNAWPGARKAVDEFMSDKPEFPIPMPDKSGSAVIVKS